MREIQFLIICEDLNLKNELTNFLTRPGQYVKHVRDIHILLVFPDLLFNFDYVIIDSTDAGLPESLYQHYQNVTFIQTHDNQMPMNFSFSNYRYVGRNQLISVMLNYKYGILQLK